MGTASFTTLQLNPDGIFQPQNKVQGRLCVCHRDSQIESKNKHPQKAGFFWSLTEKESAGLGAGVKSRVHCAPNLENTDCGTWQQRAWLILHLVLFPF